MTSSSRDLPRRNLSLLYLLLWQVDSLPLNHLGVSDREGTSDNSVTLGTDFVAMGNNVINENQKSVD